MLRQCDYQRWLTGADGEDPPVELLRPYPAEKMTATEAHLCAVVSRWRSGICSSSNWV